MDADTVSHSSVDSASLTDEFVLVNAEPRLRVVGNGGPRELEIHLLDLLAEDHTQRSVPIGQRNQVVIGEEHWMDSSVEPGTTMISGDACAGLRIEPGGDDGREVGQSVEGRLEGQGEVARQTVVTTQSSSSVNYSVISTAMSGPLTTSSSTSGGAGVSVGGQGVGVSSSHLPLSSTSVWSAGESIVFSAVTYLGAATVNAPRSEGEINRNMAILNQQSTLAIPITLSVPNHSEGIVYLLEPGSGTEIASYPIHRILFCAKGPINTSEARCFAFTCSHGDSAETAIFQCHVFRCDVTEASVSKILYSFATAFRRMPKSPTSSSGGPGGGDMQSSTPLGTSAGGLGGDVFRFGVAVEFKECDSKGNYVSCPKDKNVFKLRCNIEKRIIIVVTQTGGLRELKIERCFGLLISPGRNVKDSDMHLIDMVSMGVTADMSSNVISANWDPTDPNFKILNTETPKDSRVFLTIAIDLVMEGIQEPVRFLVEMKAKIFPTNERFWYFSTKPHIEQFILRIRPCELPGAGSQQQYEVLSIESQTGLERKKSNLSLALSSGHKLLPSPGDTSSPQEQDGADNSDGDEPLMSGSGVVSKDVTDENLLDNWRDALARWQVNLKQRPPPRQVQSLVKRGIPEALRGEVWQLLAGCTDNTEMLESYRILITKDSPSEQVIQRDINRTFPAHDYFKESGGVGQDSLYRISKAYSVYDEDINYCQGVSFLAAALLLHMPEEQAFCVLVKIMFDYGMRDMFKDNFDELHLKFYQLERLMQDQLTDLFDHFMDLGLEAHMYASQWFLTLFTAKFPLFMVFHILDLFLCEGIETIFNVALALLKTSRKDLLALDFEGVLKYFRVQLPKRYRSEEAARELLHLAVSLKVNSKKLKRYEKEFVSLKEAQMMQEDPVERLQRENKRLGETNMRLEQENDDLAHELVSSKISLRKDLDQAEDKCDVYNKELLQTKSLLLDTEEELKRLETESQQLKEVCRRELDRAESESARNQTITSDYKRICSQLSERLEKQQAAHKDELNRIKRQISSCESCSQLFSSDGQIIKISGTPHQGGQDDNISPELLDKERLVRELELELAQTKLALVESECKNQDVVHQLNTAVIEIQASKNTWFQKTLSSLKEVTAKGGGGGAGGGGGVREGKGGEGREGGGARWEMARKDSMN